ncbi:MAG: TonB-dependent receptor, partial [Thermoanaerobaculia bacterium]
AGALLVLVALPLPAQEPAEPPAQEPAPADSPLPPEPEASFFDATTVTATGSERDVFEVATPVTVIPAETIQRLEADNPASLLRTEPGVDVNGVGPNQARPVIRGQRGLRVLFLEDGLRLNNARRQTDFGEITGLVDLAGVETVEVVRGPASVLYGSDAIGGVLNVIPKRAAFGPGRRFAGFLDARYGEAGEAAHVAGGLSWRADRFDVLLGGAYHDSSDYEAPAGSFGRIRLPRDTAVADTALTDDSLRLAVSARLDDRQSLRLRGQRYRADATGFGFLDPATYGVDEEADVRIFYPYQDFDRWTLGYEGAALGLGLADTIDAKLYWQANGRQLVNDIVIDIGPLAPGFPPSQVLAYSVNTTALDTWGLRLEALRALGEAHLVTWGLETFRDESHNTDFSTTTTVLRFPFPPFEVRRVTSDAIANAPDARNTSRGVFVQDEWAAGERVRVTAGLRWQEVSTEATATPGWQTGGLDFSDDQLVGALTATWQITDSLNALVSYGTAFRAPNIIERLFNGATPEGNGYQILNPDLRSETSANWDVGFKYRRRDAFFELVAFRNEIEDGIVQDFLSPEEIAALPPEVRAEIEASRARFVVQQVNFERLRYQGVELAVGYRAPFGLTAGGNFSFIDAERVNASNPPPGGNYGEKYVGYLRYEPGAGRWWAEYRVRHNASADANLAPDEPVPPVGSVLPSFTVHALAAGARLFERAGVAHHLQVTVENLTNELYAEFSNATFFRPEPGRNVKASYRVRF